MTGSSGVTWGNLDIGEPKVGGSVASLPTNVFRSELTRALSGMWKEVSFDEEGAASRLMTHFGRAMGTWSRPGGPGTNFILKVGATLVDYLLPDSRELVALTVEFITNMDLVIDSFVVDGMNLIRNISFSVLQGYRDQFDILTWNMIGTLVGGALDLDFIFDLESQRASQDNEWTFTINATVQTLSGLVYYIPWPRALPLDEGEEKSLPSNWELEDDLNQLSSLESF